MFVSLLSTVDPLLRDLASLSLSDQADILTTDLTEDSVILRFSPREGNGWTHEVELAHACVTCSLREGIIPALADLAEAGCDALVLALPVAVEPLMVAPSLSDLMSPDGPLPTCRLTSSVHVLTLDTASHDLLDHVPLAERGIALFPGDDRCTGEVLMTSLGYADIVAALGEDTLASDLVEHLRPFDTLRVNHLEELDRDLLFSGAHNVEEAIGRVHPASVMAWGGPTLHGVWTLDLHSTRPFHPTRLAEWVGELAGSGTCARGCFWLPSRPEVVCTWEVTGGSASVGTAGNWDGPAFTHIIVTGTESSTPRDEVEAAFSRILLRDDELASAAAWVGTEDGLDAWFPEED